MKFILLVTSFLYLSSVANAGQDGGGGHPCKLSFMAMTSAIESYFLESDELQKKYPFWKDLVNVANPELNPGFKVVVKDSAIANCKDTQNALACAKPSADIIELHCGKDGWDKLNDEQRLSHALHELMWWM